MTRATTRVAAAAVAVAAAAAVATGLPVSVLPTTDRRFFKTQLGGVYTRFIAQGNCPPRIEHTGFVEPTTGVINVPFANIRMGGVQCTSAGSMVVVPNTDNTLTGLLSSLLESNDVLNSVYTQLVDSGAEFLVGFETVDRVCGPSTFRSPTVTFFVSEPEAIAVPRVAFLRPNFRPYMMVFKTNSNDGIPCTYSKSQTTVDGGTIEADDDDDDDDDNNSPVTVVPVPGPAAGGNGETTDSDDDDDDGNAGGTADTDSIDDDNDGIPDPSDPDDDNDGVVDNDDADNDGDGVADINDVPRNDGQDEDQGAPIQPVTGGEDIDSIDDDNDGIPDPSDPDDDNDGRPDNDDANNDGDGVADVNDEPRNDGQDDGEGGGAGAPVVAPVAGSGDGDNVDDDAATDSDDDDDAVTGVDGEAEPSPSDDDDSVCFPGSAEVELESGETVTMDKLSVGDSVRVSADAFSRVFMFTHKVAAGSFNFVKLTTASAASLTVTRSHYIYANGKMTAAGAVRLGDKLELVADRKCDIVTAISSVTGTGLYNPQTLHGDIVVNGIRASTYTTAVEPTVASALLSPLRALFRATGFSTSALDEGASRLAALLPNGASVY
ncbi:hypothetical protein MMPV_005692 [Pyropia vietnamensis]